MKQNKTLIFAAAALMIAASMVAAPNAKASDLAPGEGFFAGAFVGFGTGILQAKVTGLEAGANTFETARGGIGLSGIQGGGWTGWGFKTADDIYIGAELSGHGSDEKFELTASSALSSDNGTIGGNITSIQIKRNWSATPALRIGYYVNKDTLFSIKGGFAVSEFDVDIGDSSEQYYAGGPQFGATIDSRISKIDPNLSIRMEFLITNYLTADVLGRDGQGTRTGGGTGYQAELTGIDTAGRVGLTYNFNAF